MKPVAGALADGVPHWSPAAGICLDARRAVFLEKSRRLVVADLHLGFAWVQRRRGQLLPVSVADDTPARLAELCRDWDPLEIVVLGDVVHEAVPLEAVREELAAVLEAAGSERRWRLILGNHDRRLGTRLAEWGLGLPCMAEWTEEAFGFVHGDALPSGDGGECGGWVLSGHEHPAVELGDGGTRRAKVPAFLLGVGPDGRRALVVPAFSRWAAGCVMGRRPFLGAWAERVRWETAVACLGPRLLPIPVERLCG